MNLVLIGFMCSGKSSVGRQLSKKLGWNFFDTDEMVTKQVGSSVGDIIRAQGESAFRQIEKKAVQLVALSDSVVISTGGGVPLDPENMKELSRNGKVIWLKASAMEILKRAGGSFQSRPLIDPADPRGSIERRLKEREPIYSKADLTIDTDGLEITTIVDQILKKVSLPIP